LPPDLTLQELDETLRSLDALLERQRRANPLRLIRHPRRGVIPFALWTRQREFITAVRECMKVATWVGPNRAGKTVAAGAACAADLLGWPIETWTDLPWDLRTVQLGAPAAIGCVTVSKDKSRDVQQRILSEFIPRHMLACQPWNPKTGFGSDNAKLILKNGSTVDFLSDLQRGQAFEAFAWHKCWIDEAVEEWVKDRIVARLVDAGGKLLVTAVGELAWLNRIARQHLLNPNSIEPAPPGFIISVADTTMADNELLTEDELARAITMYGGIQTREARMRVLGEDVLAEGLILDRFDSRFNIEADFDPPDEWTRYEFADPGYANPFAWGFIAVEPPRKLHWYDEIYLRGKLPGEIADLVKAKRARYRYHEPCIAAVIDPAADQARMWGRPRLACRDELMQAGIRTIAGDASKGSVESGDSRINALLNEGLLLLAERCQWGIFECQNYRRQDADPKTGEYLGDREKRRDAHNHLISGLRYLLSRRPIHVPLAQASAPRGSAAADLADLARSEKRRKKIVWR